MADETTLIGLLAQAWAAYERRDLRTARGLARQARAYAPDAPDPIAALAWFHLASGQDAAAAALLKPALKEHPDAWALWWYMGLLSQRQGDLPAAADALRRACCGDPAFDEAAFTLAWVLHDLGHLTEALAWSRYALGKARTPERLQQYAWLMLQTGAAAESARLYRDVLDILPAASSDRGLLRRHYASALEQSGAPQAALAVLQEEAAAAPQEAQVLAALGWALLRLNRPAEALAVAVRLTEQSPACADGWHMRGLIDQAQGRLAEADAAYTEALARNPDLHDLIVRRAHLCVLRGERLTAEVLLRQVVDHPDAPTAAEDLLLQLLLEQRKTVEARARIHRRLRLPNAAPDLWRLLAIALDQRDCLGTAVFAVQRACRLDPQNVEAHRLLGWLAQRVGRAEQAAATVRRVVALTGGDGASAVQAALVLEAGIAAGAATLAEAAAMAEHAVVVDPMAAEAWAALGHIRLRQQRWDEAEAILRAAAALDPTSLEVVHALARLYGERGRLAEAAALLTGALGETPACRLLLAETHQKACRYTEGLTALAPLRDAGGRDVDLRAASLLVERAAPGDWDAAMALCQIAAQGGDAAEPAGQILARLAALGSAAAVAALDRLPRALRWKAYHYAIRVGVYRYGNGPFCRLIELAAARYPDDSWADTAAFFAAGLDENQPMAARGVAARRWYRRLRARAGIAAPRKLPPGFDGDKINIAYIGSYFHATLLRSVLTAHDPARVRVYLYTDAPIVAAEWGVIHTPLTGTDLAKSFAANRIDVAIDTVAPHGFEGQDQVVTALAHRLAPVQIGWLGTWGPGGGLFDALLTDAEVVPSGAEVQYDEEILRIPGGQWAWTPPPETQSPPPGPLPALTRGGITFTATVRGLRLSPRTFTAWAKILAGVPNARLIVLGYQAEDGPQQRAFTDTLRAEGVDPARVTYQPPCSYAALLQFYQTVDIALDAVPANGGLCLLDPLWMGVPFVSAAGPWASDRQGRSILAAVGLVDLCGESDADFIAIAISLAQDQARLAELRRGLRARVQAAPLTDGVRIARFIEASAVRLRAEAQPIAMAENLAAHTIALADRAFRRWCAQGGRLTFAEPASPKISVILPSDGPIGLLWESLCALADQTHRAFDVCMDNPPKALRACVSGLRSSKRLRAPYRLALAPGVIVQQDALAQAIAALDRDTDSDAVTGRLIAADGALLEAGRLPTSAGPDAEYGRGGAADAPEFRFQRRTPSAHAGFLATRGHRAERILYVPDLVAQHLAEASPRPEPLPGEVKPFVARWADRCGPRLLILDDAVPLLTAGAGLPRARAVLHALADLPVTLFPLWHYDEDWRAVYRAVPATLEVMLGLGAAKLEAFLDVRRGVYEAILVSRPPNLARLKALQARRPELFEGVALLYDAEAVFAQREIGEAAIAGHPVSATEAAARIARELALAEGVDRVLVVSEGDRALYCAAGFADVRLLAHAIAPRRTAPGPAGRQGLLFVGALDPKTPNEDSLLWFVTEILPRLPEVTLTIVGACRSARVAALAGGRVQVLGPQEDLTPFYDRARVFIAPTRFAGGVPAKVIEAAAHGIPVVATPLLVEQLSWEAGDEILSAETPVDFAARITRLLTDDGLWARLQTQAWDRVETLYDPAAFAAGVRAAVCDPLPALTRQDDGEIVV